MKKKHEIPFHSLFHIFRTIYNFYIVGKSVKGVLLCYYIYWLRLYQKPKVEICCLALIFYNIGPLTMIGGTLGCHGQIFGVPKIFFKISATKSGLWWGERSEPNQSTIFVVDFRNKSETVLNFSFSDNLGLLFVAD